MGIILAVSLGALLGWIAGHVAVVVPEGRWRSFSLADLLVGRQMEHKLGALLLAAGSGAAFATRSSLTDWVVTVGFLLLLTSLLLIDLRHHLVFPVMTLVGFVAALVLNPLAGEETFLSSLVGGLAGAGGFFLLFLLGLLIFRVQALGFGDVLLALMIGAMTGFRLMPGTLMLGTLLSAGASVGLLLLGRKGRRDYIPFGSGMCLAAIIVLVLRV